MLFHVRGRKLARKRFHIETQVRNYRPVAATGGFTLIHHVLAHSVEQMKIRLHTQIKTRLDLQDRLDTIDASAKTMMSTSYGLAALENTMQQLLSGPGVATVDRQWLRDQLCRVCVRQRLPFNML